MKKLLLFTLLLMYSVVTIAQEKPEHVSPFYDGNLLTGMDLKSNENVYTDGFATLLEAFTFGGNRLVALQNNDGGWDWPLDDGDPNSVSPVNTLGPIAMGLAQAYQQTGIVTQRTTLLDAGNLLLLKIGTFSPSDGYLAAQLDKIFGGTTYSTYVKINFYDKLAAGTYERAGYPGVFYTTASYVQRIRDTRSGTQANMAAWDIGMGLVGAAMCSASTTAWIDGVKAEINELDGNAWYDVIGLAGALYGLAFVNEDFDPTAGWHIAASNINDLAATLASYQIAGGGFAWNQAWVIPNDGNETIQETAYAILALNEVNRTLYLTNIQGAANYTMSVQLGTGGWENYPTSGENNEITGEALWGMSVAYPAPVYNSTKDVYYLTIQGAINDANSGDIINVAAGTYLEAGQIVINKNLSLTGENKTTTIVKPLQSTGSSGDAQAWWLIMDGINFNLTNVTLDGSGYDVRTGVRFRGNGTVDNCLIKNITYPGYQGFGLALTFQTTSSMNVTVSNCEFNNIGRVGIHIDRNGPSSPTSTGTVINNTYVGKGIGDHLDYAIEVEGGAHAIITNNTISNCLGVALSDGSTSAGILATTYFDNGTSALVNNNQFNNNSTAIAVGFNASDLSQVEAHNNSFTNCEFGVTSTAPPVNAELNWWGTAVESEIQAMINGPVDYDPWIGKAVTVTQTTPTTYDFPGMGVKMSFTTLPAGGGNVTVLRYNEAYTPFPVGYSNVALWLDITSTMPNYSFNATISVDILGIAGFDATTTVMYRTTSGTWLAVPGGIYSASDPLFGGHPSFSFVTNHFTPFTFINTPANAKNVYLSTSNTVIGGTIYPNTDWGVTGYELPLGDDWDFTTPVSLYIVPEAGSQFGATTITIQWDNTVYNYVGVDKTGGIYDNAAYFFNTLPSANQVIIDAGRYDNLNFTVNPGQYIAKINFSLIKPGFNPISFSALDFRAFDGIGGQLGVFVTGNNAQVKSYLGDVASNTSTLTGDGLVDFYDLSPWSISYWSGVGGFGMANYKVKYDVGPTSTNNVYGIPAVDGKIQFEDFVIFAMSYGLSANHIYPKIESEPTAPVDLQLGEPIIAGIQTRIPLFVSGGVQNVRAMSLTFAGQFGRLVSVEKGTLLTEFTNPVMVMSNVEGNQVYVDLAVFGAEELGINQEGEVLTLVFEGNTEINLNTADIRNILNSPMAVNISGSEGLVPAEFALMQNYPNPFNPTTTINYNLPKQAMVEISIYNALGEKVATVVNEIKEAGKHTVEFNAVGYSSGIYFYQIKANDYVSVKKMILMK